MEEKKEAHHFVEEQSHGPQLASTSYPNSDRREHDNPLFAAPWSQQDSQDQFCWRSQVGSRSLILKRWPCECATESYLTSVLHCQDILEDWARGHILCSKGDGARRFQIHDSTKMDDSNNIPLSNHFVLVCAPMFEVSVISASASRRSISALTRRSPQDKKTSRRRDRGKTQS